MLLIIIVLIPKDKSIYPSTKVLFNVIERTFEDVECTFSDAERTFNIAERNFLIGKSTFFLIITKNFPKIIYLDGRDLRDKVWHDLQPNGFKEPRLFNAHAERIYATGRPPMRAVCLSNSIDLND